MEPLHSLFVSKKMKVQSIKTRIFKENENLFDFILKYIPKVKERDIIVITSKIVALSEGRTAVFKTEKEKEKIIKAESSFAFKTKFVWLTIKDQMVMANAGIDESNANGKIVLLPKNSFSTAQVICNRLKKFYKIKNLGVIISDSAIFPMRTGVLGSAIGYAGFQGVKEYIGKKDIFGRKLEFSSTNLADSLATTATVCMGEGDEQRPLAVIKDAPVVFIKKIKSDEISINPKEDMFFPMIKNIKDKSYAKKK